MRNKLETNSQTRFSESWGAQRHQMGTPPLFVSKRALKPSSRISSVWC